jgi:hypothetical protein
VSRNVTLREEGRAAVREEGSREPNEDDLRKSTPGHSWSLMTMPTQLSSGICLKKFPKDGQLTNGLLVPHALGAAPAIIEIAPSPTLDIKVRALLEREEVNGKVQVLQLS